MKSVCLVYAFPLKRLKEAVEQSRENYLKDCKLSSATYCTNTIPIAKPSNSEQIGCNSQDMRPFGKLISVVMEERALGHLFSSDL